METSTISKIRAFYRVGSNEPTFSCKKGSSLNCIIFFVPTNSYGHPHKETLERLESVATSIYRTDELGQITCSCKRNGPFTVRSVIKQ